MSSCRGLFHDLESMSSSKKTRPTEEKLISKVPQLFGVLYLELKEMEVSSRPKTYEW